MCVPPNSWRADLMLFISWNKMQPWGVGVEGGEGARWGRQKGKPFSELSPGTSGTSGVNPAVKGKQRDRQRAGGGDRDSREMEGDRDKTGEATQQRWGDRVQGKETPTDRHAGTDLGRGGP